MLRRCDLDRWGRRSAAVRSHAYGLCLQERKELDTTGLDDGLRVQSDFRPTSAVLGERGELAAEQPDTTLAKARQSAAPSRPVLYDRRGPDGLEGLGDELG